MDLNNYELIEETDQNELKLSNSISHSCQYNEVNEFKTFIDGCHEYFSIFSLNIRSLSKKVSDLEELILETKNDTFQFSILCLQELWNVRNKGSLSINGYHPISSTSRVGRQGGGVGIYVRESLKFEVIQHLSLITNDFESIVAKVYVSETKFKIVVNLYRIPNGSFEVFSQWVTNTLHSLKKDNSDEIIVTGDFNINFLRYNDHGPTNDFLNSLLSQSFLPMITLPTRITQTCANLLDNIFTNKQQESYQGGLLYSDISDHLPIFYINATKKSTQSQSHDMKRYISKRKIDLFKQSLNATNWTPVLEETRPNIAFQRFSDEVNTRFEHFFPLEKIKPNKRCIPIKPWMTKKLLELRKSKDKLFKSKIKDRTDVANSRFKAVSRSYKSEVRRAKREYYHKKFTEYSNDIKKTWQTINTLIKKSKKTNSIPSLFKDEFRKYETFSDIAEGFNSFFVNVGQSLANNIPDSDVNFRDFLREPVEQSFVFQNITETIIYDTLSKLKPKLSCGHDNISMNLLKQIMPCILSPVIYLFNLSFKTGYIPQDYKIAKIIPIFKAGEMNKFDNYRPISILSAFSKLMEKIVVCQMMKYLNKYKILYEHQYGFREKRDTSQPIMQLLNKIYQGLNKENSEYTISIFIDLKKAFDTCDLEILLKKMDFYGFRGISQKWFCSYLKGRFQYVEINGVKSSLKGITHGVPQGSVLGPILFLIYINDLPNSLNLFSSLFADDTIFTNSSNDLSILQNCTNDQLNKAEIWFQTNKLSLNVSKTKYMVFSSTNMNRLTEDFKIYIGGREVERIGSNCETKSFKFVGVYLDEFLTWEHHINHIINKISSSSFVLNQLKKIVPLHIRKTLYNSLVKSHIDYAIIAWGNSDCKGMKRLKTKNKQAIRNVANAKFNAHVDPILKELEVLDIEATYTYFVADFVKKLFLNKLPTSFNSMFEKMSSQRVFKLKCEKPKNKSLELFPKVAIPRLWNSLENNIRMSSSCRAMKESLRDKVMSRYENFNCDKNKCYVCQK